MGTNPVSTSFIERVTPSDRAPRMKIKLYNLLNDATDSIAVKRAMREALKNSSVRVEFGTRVIEKIQERMESSMGVSASSQGFRNKALSPPPYSKAYINSRPFQIYKGSKKVNLELRGDMKAAMSVINTDNGSVTIGFTSDAEGLKARGHIVGDGTAPKRDFFGLPKTELIEIMKQTIKDNRTGNLQTQLLLEQLASISTTAALSVAVGERQTVLLTEDLFET